MIDRHCDDKNCTEGEIASMLEKHLTNCLAILDYAIPTAWILPPNAAKQVLGAVDMLAAKLVKNQQELNAVKAKRAKR